jgi:rod shape-determining protein MreC
LASTRIRAILHGTVTGGLQIGNLTADSRIKPGETVLTSGGDQVYPRGLAVGTIESIAPDPERQPYTAIVVKPTVNLSRIDEVLVITQMQSDLPPGAAQDLSAAEARHAADLSAERLPGVESTGAPTTLDGGVDAVPGTQPATPTPAAPVVPRPPPAAHPDRFTPGSTPPAAEMIPGGSRSGPNESKNGENSPAETSPVKKPENPNVEPKTGTEPQAPQ